METKIVFEGNAEIIQQEGGYCSPAIEIMVDGVSIDLTTWIQDYMFGAHPVLPLRITIEVL